MEFIGNYLLAKRAGLATLDVMRRQSPDERARYPLSQAEPLVGEPLPYGRGSDLGHDPVASQYRTKMAREVLDQGMVTATEFQVVNQPWRKASGSAPSAATL
jgi:hypothetical protein